MATGRAAVFCVRVGCPSAIAVWEPITEDGMLVADVYTCLLCDITWIETRPT